MAPAPDPRDAQPLSPPAGRPRVQGPATLADPLVNRGTAFTWSERRARGLVGLLPPAVTTLESQARRAYAQYVKQPDDLAKHLFLAAQRDRNEVLFYKLISDHLTEMLPIIYTPTVGRAIQEWSSNFRKPRGVFLSVDRPEEIGESFANTGLGADDVDLIVVTDGEGILGIGDWGIGGIDIAIGKLEVYTAAAGIDPGRVIPVVLDVGTDNVALLNDPLYLGTRRARVRGAAYDDFVDDFVRAIAQTYPDALLHWEDLGTVNARRVLTRHHAHLPTFNDDIQGTGATVVAAVTAGAALAGSRLRDQRVVVLGPGSAGVGIADMIRDAMVRDGLPPDEATARFWFVDKVGLLTDDRTDLLDFQQPYARPAAQRPGQGGLLDVVGAAHPTVLIGTSTARGAFDEKVVRTMAAHVDRPIILPLSNPTSRSEAVPADVLAWTEGRALVATGSPFPPVVVDGRAVEIAQANNALVFPGLGLGVIVARASQVTDGMLHAAAESLAGLAVRGAATPGAGILPGVDQLRVVSAVVAMAVAQAAERDGVARVALANPVQQVYDAMWQPVYPT